MNIVGNYCKGGPGGIIGHRIYLAPRTYAHGRVGPYKRGVGRFHLAGNYVDVLGGYVEPWRAGPKPAANVVGKPFGFPAVAMHSAEQAYELILAHGGCLPRSILGF